MIAAMIWLLISSAVVATSHAAAGPKAASLAELQSEVAQLRHQLAELAGAAQVTPAGAWR
jgi:hypothetical protein